MVRTLLSSRCKGIPPEPHAHTAGCGMIVGILIEEIGVSLYCSDAVRIHRSMPLVRSRWKESIGRS